LLRFVLNNFEIEEKIFLIVRDSAEVMIKVANDLGFKSIDCFAHKLNLVFLICPIGFYNFQSIWDGMRIISDENNLKCLIERIKKFVRKLRKSKIQRNEFENIQKIIELPQLILIKDSEVDFNFNTIPIFNLIILRYDGLQHLICWIDLFQIDRPFHF